MKAAVFEGPGRPRHQRCAHAGNRRRRDVGQGASLRHLRHRYPRLSRGPFYGAPETVFGHEFVGDIVEVGAAVPGGQFAPGDRVTSLPFIGEKTIGLGEISGAYSEYVKVGHELVLKIPESLSDDHAALIEPLAVGLHSVKMAEGIAEKDVLIIGAGPIGLACAVGAVSGRAFSRPE